MRTYWKRFGEWVTSLRRDPFTWARFKLTVFYSFVIVSAIIFYLALLNKEFNREVFIFAKEVHAGARGRFITRALRLSSTTLFTVQPEDIFMLFITIGISYTLAGVALQPIRKIVISQKQFLADASHELRTPLSIIRTELEVFLRDKSSWILDENFLIKKRQSIVSNLEEIDRMQQIIDNLLFLSRADSYQENFRFTKLNLFSLLSQIIQRINETAKRTHIRLSLKGDKNLIVLGDPIRLEQAFLNLVKNGIKYTNKGGSVKIAVCENNDHAEVSVIDNGIGIADRDLPHVFKRFFQARNGTVAKTEGLGLGLTIANMIVVKHKGRIDIKSTLGIGTTVKVSLPLLHTL